MPDCWIGIGANVGAVGVTFDSAWSVLAQASEVRMGVRSGLYQTRPVGAEAGGAFTNAVFCLTSPLAPIQVLDLLQSVESSLGRTRGVHWGPRTVDLDLLFVEDQIVSDPRLSVPHPAAWYRRFVLDPLVEVAPQLRHPLLNETVSELRNRLLERPFTVALQELSQNFLSRWRSEIAPQFPMVRLAACGDSEASPTMSVRLDMTEPAAPMRSGIPVADLTSAPGHGIQRVRDFLTSALDEPVRVGEW